MDKIFLKLQGKENTIRSETDNNHILMAMMLIHCRDLYISTNNV